ncbi:predicted protein [Naegleria gruberi]|uniref:Predicted protein n=1 Tax=Naegleria gruberi TaxID=5762 RepID=D2V187_NAEGR|nr:uncharacterized protein NAEGRDRAFT_46022 [Naegleria gruberi]EFC49425.1 predicted protein [Naegleria gruberi]|eukprot:XP_002682169.1 predicted protein [Naegleria gruberi strain NEG-M]
MHSQPSDKDKKLIIKTLVSKDRDTGDFIPPALIRVLVKGYDFNEFPLEKFMNNLANKNHPIFLLKSNGVWVLLRSKEAFLNVICSMLDDFSFHHIDKTEFRNFLKPLNDESKLKYNFLHEITHLSGEKELLQMMKDFVEMVAPRKAKSTKKPRSKKSKSRTESSMNSSTLNSNTHSKKEEDIKASDEIILTESEMENNANINSFTLNTQNVIMFDLNEEPEIRNPPITSDDNNQINVMEETPDIINQENINEVMVMEETELNTSIAHSMNEDNNNASDEIILAESEMEIILEGEKLTDGVAEVSNKKKMGEQVKSGNLSLADVMEELRKIRNEIMTKSEFNTNIDSMKSDINNIKNDVHNMKNDINTVRTDINNMKTDINNMKTDINNMKNDIKKINNNVDSMKTDITKVKTDIKSMKNDISNMKTDIDNMQTDIHNIKSESNIMNYEIKEVKSDISTIRVEIRGICKTTCCLNVK